MSDEAPLRGLLIDWGGVLTTDIFVSFEHFCRNEGLDPLTVRDLFRNDAEARHTLFALETGELTEPEFEERFARILTLREDRAAGLVDRLFAGMKEDIAMFDAVRDRARPPGIRTGLLSNSWGVDRYDRSQFPRFFDAVVISGEEGVRKPDRADLRHRARAHGAPGGRDRLRRRPPRQPQARARARHGDASTTSSAGQSVPELERLLGLTLR